jgi:protein-disulfide isomerase
MKMSVAGVAAGVMVVLALASWLKAPPPEETASNQDQAVQTEAPQDAMIALRTKGAADAPVTIFEVSDFQCPFCRQFWAETLPALEREYIDTGKIRFIFINLPLVSLHPNAPAAHEFAMCAARQERFWPIHDLLYQYQEQWASLEQPGPFFLGLADSVALERPLLAECLAKGTARPIVAADVQQATSGGIRSTPTFIIEGGVLQGAEPMETWRPILDSIITAKAGG